MRMKLALLLVVLMLANLFVGCSDNSNKNEQGKTSNGEMDIVYYAYNAIPILTWDPSIEFSNGIIPLNNIYETLLRFNPENKEYEKILATDYEKSEDGLTWIFKLRENVNFQDGTPFTAEAVKFSFERTKKIGQGAAFVLDPISEINIIDDYTVEFKLAYVAPMDIIVSCPYAVFIMPPSVKDKPDNWFEEGNACGTGPYKLQSSTMGDEIILTKNDDYWKGWDGEHFEKAIIKKVAETSSRRQLIEKGEADITVELPSEDIEALQKAGNVTVEVLPSFMNLMGFFNTQKEPLNDVKVRRALSYAFPYDDVVKYAMGGFASQSYGPIPNGMWGYSENLMQFGYDLDKAKELLEEAGLKPGELKLLLTYMSGDEAEKKTAELYKAELSKIGVELEIRSMPWESQWELSRNSNVKDAQDIMLMYWWTDLATPYSYLYSLFHSEDAPLYNLSYYKNAEFDKLIDDAQEKTALNIEKAEEDFIKAQEILIEDCPAMFMYDKNVAWVKSPTLKGHKDNPAYPFVIFFYDCYREK